MEKGQGTEISLASLDEDVTTTEQETETSKEEETSSATETQNEDEEESSNESEESENEDENGNGLLNYFESNDSLVLEAFALDSGWISVTIDGKKKEEILMPPGMTKVWKAKDYFVITEGNSGAVKFTRNGETLEPFGSRGKVVTNVKITEENIEK